MNVNDFSGGKSDRIEDYVKRVKTQAKTQNAYFRLATNKIDMAILLPDY